MEGSRQSQNHFFGDDLYGGSNVHFTLRQFAFGLSGWATKELIETLVGHGQPGAVVEVLHVQAKGAVGLQIQKSIQDQFGILRGAIRGQPHELVFAGVDAESGEVGKRRIKEPQRVGENQSPKAASGLFLLRPRQKLLPTLRHHRDTEQQPYRRG